MSKKIIIGLNTFNSDTKVSNSNWENSTSEPVFIEQGDTIALKSSFIDTRNRVSGNIILDQDTTIELSYYFYYINRGGTTIKSRVIDTPIVPPAVTPPTQLFPNRQQLCQEYYNPTNDYTKNPGFGNVLPTGVPFTTPVANNSSDKTPENLAPLAESIYHCYSSDKVKNWIVDYPTIGLNEIKKGVVYELIGRAETPDNILTSVGCSAPVYDGKVFTASIDGTDIDKNPNAEIQFKDIDIQAECSIDKIGLPYLGGYDTDWLAIGYDYTKYPGSINFTSNTTPAATSFITALNNLNAIVEGITYSITSTSDYIQWDLYGATKPTNTNPLLNLSSTTNQSALVNDKTYNIINKGIAFKDGFDTDWVSLGATSNNTDIFTYSTIDPFPLITFGGNVSELFHLQVGHIISMDIPADTDDTVYFNQWDLFGAPITDEINASQAFPVSFNTTITHLGAPFVYKNFQYDTIWNELGDLNQIPSVGDKYMTIENLEPIKILVENDFSGDFSGLIKGVNYTILSTNDNMDWTQYGLETPTNNNPIIPASSAVPGQIYEIVDKGFAFNNFPNFVNTDTNFSQGGAFIINPTRFLCNSPITSTMFNYYQGGADAIVAGMTITLVSRGIIGGPFSPTTKPFDWSPYGGPNTTGTIPATFVVTKDLMGLEVFEAPFEFELNFAPTATIRVSPTQTGGVFTATDTSPNILHRRPINYQLEVNPTGRILAPYSGNLQFEVLQIPEKSDIEGFLEIPAINLIPTGEIQEIMPYTVPFTFKATSTGSYVPYDDLDIKRTDLTYTANIIPTGSVQAAYEIAQVKQILSSDDNYVLANNPVGFSNTQDVNQPDGLPYLLCYSAPTNIDGTTNFDKSILKPGDLVPFIKKWKMTLKAGSYSPDYMAEIISRGMSIQKSKINRTSKISTAKNSFLGTPNQGIHSQMYKTPDLSYLLNWDALYFTSGAGGSGKGYFGYSARDCQQGPFPYKNQIASNKIVPPSKVLFSSTTTAGSNSLIDINKSLDPNSCYVPAIPTTYQPQLFFNSKNKNIMPGYNGNSTTLPAELPVNPKYTDLDFDNPDTDYKDDNPFIYRPNAFTHVDKNQTAGNVRLIFNDYNLNNYNDMPVFGDISDENIKCIEMMYRPLINDIDSSYYNNLQEKYGLPVTKQYSIRPVISAAVASSTPFQTVDGQPAEPPLTMPGFDMQFSAVFNNRKEELVDFTGANGVGYSAPCDISTPVVGANLMALSYNNENNGLFEFPYMHTPIYTKPLTTGSSLQEATAMYPSTITTLNDNDGKVDWSVYIKHDTPYKVSSDLTGLGNILFTFTGANYQNKIYSLEKLDVQVENIETDTFIYWVYSGSLFPGGIDGLNDLTIIVSEWTNLGTGFYKPLTFSVSGIAPLTSAAGSYSTNSNVIQIGSQSGIIFKDMKATKADGTSMPFWEQLGFDVANITHKYDPKKPNDFTLDYETFTKSTTTGFQGTSTIFDPETLASGTTEMSYVSYIDSLNMLGWYTPSSYNLQPTGLCAVSDGTLGPNVIIPETSPLYQLTGGAGGVDSIFPNGQAVFFNGNFTLQNKILYSAVETTNSLAAKIVFSDFTDTGHALVSIEGYNGSILLTNVDKLNVKSLVSTYYTGPNAFITNSSSDSAIYEHIGMPMKLQNFKTRILSPYTGKELANLGPNTSIYLEVTKTINKDNATNITFDN